MTIRQLYRSWVAVVGEFTYNDSGRPKAVYSDIQWIKGNVQPWKKGEALESTTQGLLVFKDYKVVFTANPIETASDEELDIPPEASDIEFKRNWMYVGDKWYALMQTQDWTTPNRGVKHYKHFILHESGSVQEVVPPFTPTPMAKLVDDFGVSARETFNNLKVLENIKGEG